MHRGSALAINCRRNQSDDNDGDVDDNIRRRYNRVVFSIHREFLLLHLLVAFVHRLLRIKSKLTGIRFIDVTNSSGTERAGAESLVISRM